MLKPNRRQRAGMHYARERRKSLRADPRLYRQYAFPQNTFASSPWLGTGIERESVTWIVPLDMSDRAPGTTNTPLSVGFPTYRIQLRVKGDYSGDDPGEVGLPGGGVIDLHQNILTLSFLNGGTDFVFYLPDVGIRQIMFSIRMDGEVRIWDQFGLIMEGITSLLGGVRWARAGDNVLTNVTAGPVELYPRQLPRHFANKGP